jgi:hypothetical protein
MAIGSFFVDPSAWGIGLALVFGAIWLAALKPGYLKSPAPWLVFLAGAALLAPSIAWIQAPLQTWVGNRLIQWLGLTTYRNRIWFTAIPVVLLSGLVQEGAKLAPVVTYWLTKHRTIDARLGLTIGALAGAGFGIVEAQWALNSIFAAGWSWQMAQVYGFLGIAGFWERFFSIAFHTSSTALAGWGLSKGHGWQFYLLCSFLHFLTNYTVIFLQKGLINTVQIEIIIAVFASILFAVVLWLRWRKAPASNHII